MNAQERERALLTLGQLDAVRDEVLAVLAKHGAISYMVAVTANTPMGTGAVSIAGRGDEPRRDWMLKRLTRFSRDRDREEMEASTRLVLARQQDGVPIPGVPVQ